MGRVAAPRTGRADRQGCRVMRHVFPHTGAVPGLDPGATLRSRLGPFGAPRPAHGSGPGAASVVGESSQQPIGSVAPSTLRGAHLAPPTPRTPPTPREST